MINVTTDRTDKGAIWNVRIKERMVSYFVSSELEAHEILGSHAVTTGEAVYDVLLDLETSSSDLTSTGFNKRASAEIAKRVAPLFKGFQSAIPAAHADLDITIGNLGSPIFPVDQSPSVRVEQRQFARPMPLPALLQAVQNDPTLAAAIVEGGLSMSGLPADIFHRVQDEMRIANATARFMAQAAYKTRPSVDDPVGGKLDYQAARADGAALIRAFDQKRALLDDAPAMLASVVNIVALVTDTDRAAALDLLMAA